MHTSKCYRGIDYYTNTTTASQNNANGILADTTTIANTNLYNYPYNFNSNNELIDDNYINHNQNNDRNCDLLNQFEDDNVIDNSYLIYNNNNNNNYSTNNNNNNNNINISDTTGSTYANLKLNRPNCYPATATRGVTSTVTSNSNSNYNETTGQPTFAMPLQPQQQQRHPPSQQQQQQTQQPQQPQQQQPHHILNLRQQLQQQQTSAHSLTMPTAAVSWHQPQEPTHEQMLNMYNLSNRYILIDKY